MSKYFVEVKFKGNDKSYLYMINDNVHFESDKYYMIETAEGDKYTTPVYLFSRSKNNPKKDIRCKTIVKATPIKSPKIDGCNLYRLLIDTVYDSNSSISQSKYATPENS